jgi:hypothetical protein
MAYSVAWFGTIAAALSAGVGHAEYSGGRIKIGVLSDQSNLYADIARLDCAQVMQQGG